MRRHPRLKWLGASTSIAVDDQGTVLHHPYAASNVVISPGGINDVGKKFLLDHIEKARASVGLTA